MGQEPHERRDVPLVAHKAGEARGILWQARNQIIGRVAAGEALAGVASFAAAVIERHAPIAAVINEFYRQLHLVDRRTPYPAAAARAAWAIRG